VTEPLFSLAGKKALVTGASRGRSSFVTPFLDLRQSGWDKVLRLNLDSTMWICQAAGAHMTARGTGSVINVAPRSRGWPGLRSWPPTAPPRPPSSR